MMAAAKSIEEISSATLKTIAEAVPADMQSIVVRGVAGQIAAAMQISGADPEAVEGAFAFARSLVADAAGAPAG